MSIQIKYAYRRHNTWTYRRTYPQHLRDLLGSSLKQSLKTSDAKIARKRVEELNTKFTDIVQEAEGHAAENDTPSESRQIGVAVPRYHRARFLGQRPVAELAAKYLTEASERLRPGSFKSVRFALELLVSHVGEAQARDPRKSYWVFVEDLQGKTHQVSTFDDENVICFAEKVSAKTGVPFLLLSFIVNEQQVEFGRRVGDYEVGPDCSFRMTGRLIE